MSGRIVQISVCLDAMEAIRVLARVLATGVIRQGAGVRLLTDAEAADVLADGSK